METLTIPQPNPRQMDFLRAEARFIAYGGARGGGKSWAIRQKAKLLALRYGENCRMPPDPPVQGGDTLRGNRLPGGTGGASPAPAEGIGDLAETGRRGRRPLQGETEYCPETAGDSPCGGTGVPAEGEDTSSAPAGQLFTKGKAAGVGGTGIRILILRRTFPELRENHILPLRRELKGVAEWREGEKAFNFPNGSRILFGHCAGEHDVDQFQGQEYDIIFIDEATHFTEYQFSVLTACLRGANGYPKRMYLTCNPGGVGHMWVKRLFIDRAFRTGEDPDDYVFIQARAADNPALVESDPGYLKMLDNLPDGLRQAWRDGRWDVFAGQYFPEFRRESHVVPPRMLPERWPRYRVFDYGLDMLACFWAAIDHTGRIWIYREFCRSGLIVSDAARAIREMTAPDEHIRCTIAPPDLWSTQKDSGRTMAEIFAACGVPLVRAANQRVQGWMAMKEFLKKDGEELPGLVVFPECRRLIRDISAVQHDGRNPADVAVQPHEYTHTVDAVRYLCAFRAVGAEAAETEREAETVGYDDYMTGGETAESYLRFG